MKKLITLIALLIVTLTSFATNYYISNSGNDGASGTLAAPWATLTKVNNSMGTFVAGDSILFQRGGTFTGTLNVTTAGIIIGAYGTGNKPVLTGFYTIPSWTSAGTNLWTATIPAGLNWVRLLTINDRVTRVGRQPNYADNATAWYRYNSALAAVSPINVPTSTAIPTNLADGELVLCKYNWYLDVMPINSISGTTVNCNNPRGLFGIADGPGNNRGFFVQNSINALDVQNEWHYNNSTKVVTMFSTTNPSTLGTIKIPRQTNIVTLGGTSSVTLDNLELQGCSEKAITATGSNITIKNCNVKYVQGWGIDVRGSNFNIQNNWVRDIGSNGMYVSQTGNISGNLIETCGNIEGLAGLTNSGAGTQNNQSDQHIGINIETSYSGSVTCRFNTIDSTGYNGIRWYGSNVRIEKNYISYPCIAKSDGGGIYTWGENVNPAFTNQVVKNNVVLNSGKYLFGTETPGLNVNSYGIYLDAGARNVIVDSNVIGPCLYGPNSICNTPNTVYNGGLYFNGVQNVTVRNNIVTGWPAAIAIFRQTAAKVPVLNGIISGLYITKNAFYVSGAGSELCDIEVSTRYFDYGASAPSVLRTQIQGFGTIDSNYVSGNTVPSPFMYGSDGGNASFPLTLTRWRSETGKDLNSTSFPNSTPTFIINYGSTGTDTVINFNGFSKIDYAGVVYNNFMTIPPYYGTLLFDNGTTTPIPTVTSYYISNTGDDTRDGKSPSTAWKTITKLNNSWALINPGDNILFERGGTFTGTITVGKSGTSASKITIGAYGTGNNPVLSGMTPVTSWTLTATPNVYTATVNTTTDINVVAINDVITGMGRFPNLSDANEGWLTMSDLTSNTLTSSTPLALNWTNAIAVFRNRPYLLAGSTITSQPSSTLLNITPYDQGIEFTSGGGFFIQKDVRTVDVDGEWYFNNTTNLFTLYSNANPSTKTIKAATTNRLIDLNGKSDIVIENLSLEGSHDQAIYGSPVTNITVQNCSVKYANTWAMYFGGKSSEILVQNCTVRDCLTDGIYLDNRGTVTNNTVKNIGTILGMAVPGANSRARAVTIESVGDPTGGNMTCTNNTIDSVGYIGIYFGGSNILIKNNVVSNISLTKCDGGSIYAFGKGEGTFGQCTNRIIRKNIVVNNRKLLYGLPNGRRDAETRGIYLDGYAWNVIVDSNTVGNIRGEGIFGNNNQNIVVRANVVFNTAMAIRFNRLECENPNVRNVTVTSNVLHTFPSNKVAGLLNPATNIYFPDPNGSVGYAQKTFLLYKNSLENTSGIFNEIGLMGYMDSNYIVSPGAYEGQAHLGACINGGYGNPFVDSLVTRSVFTTKTTSVAHPAGFEVNFKATPTSTPSNVDPILVYNTTNSNLTVNFTDGYARKDYAGITYSNSITLAPYEGTVLFANGATGGIVVTATANPATIACFGGTTTVTVSATGGTAPYTGTGTFTRAAGTWSFTVTDATTPTANSGSTSITLTQPSAALTVTLTPTNVTCFGSANGTITTTVTGGTPTYSYSWGGGVTTANRTSLSPNNYSVNVTDSRGCLAAGNATITQPTQLTMGIPTAGRITSIGGTTTVTAVPASGGTAPYTYSINGGTTYQSSTTFTSIAAGSRTVIARDFNLCTTSKTIVITQPNQPLIINRPIKNLTFMRGKTLGERLNRTLTSTKKNRYKPKLYLHHQEQEEDITDILDFAGSTATNQTIKLNLKDNVFILRASDVTTKEPSVNFRLINNTIINKILAP